MIFLQIIKYRRVLKAPLYKHKFYTHQVIIANPRQGRNNEFRKQVMQMDVMRKQVYPEGRKCNITNPHYNTFY